ncbi:hypothetical protein TGRUB_300070 [Toxoplasma gondii RUB]|uniref:AP2-coincident C-terminal domain-containing protein n=2 Tax=Toxoplasma gondii TaxID=5811 RepID=A0A086LK55_TOXGO|nr:hypothetical protein TGRUB_300070 [Toxoplasma gondii RUB]KFG99638.1 hypothetical protein TGVAND_300070 [Toxoplasma gondii VAND]
MAGLLPSYYSIASFLGSYQITVFIMDAGVTPEYLHDPMPPETSQPATEHCPPTFQSLSLPLLLEGSIKRPAMCRTAEDLAPLSSLASPQRRTLSRKRRRPADSFHAQCESFATLSEPSTCPSAMVSTQAQGEPRSETDERATVWFNSETNEVDSRQVSGHRTTCFTSANVVARLGCPSMLTAESSEGPVSNDNQQQLTRFFPQFVDTLPTSALTTESQRILTEACPDLVFGEGSSPAVAALPSDNTRSEATATWEENGEAAAWGCGYCTESETAPTAPWALRPRDVEGSDGDTSHQAVQSLLVPLEFLPPWPLDSELPETSADHTLATEAVSYDEDTRSTGGRNGDASALVEHQIDLFDQEKTAAVGSSLPQTPSASAALGSELHLRNLLAFITPVLSALAAALAAPCISATGLEAAPFPGLPGPSVSSCDIELSQKAIRLIFRDLQHVCLPLLTNTLSMSPAEAEYVSTALKRHADMIDSVTSAPLPQINCISPYGFSLLFWPYLSIFKKCLIDCVMPSSLSKFEQIRLLLLVCNTPEPPGAPGATAYL